MRNRLFVILLAAAGTAARAQAVDCAAQKGADARAGCTAIAASVAAVADLGAVAAKQTKALAAEQAGLSAATVAQLTADQTEWVGWLATVCKAVDPETPDPTPEKLALCLQRPFEERLALLEGARKTFGGLPFVLRTRSLAVENGDNDTPDGEYPDYGTLRVAWPVAESVAPEWIAWNAGMEAEARRVMAPDRALLSEWSPSWGADRDATLETTVESVGQDRVAVKLEDDQFGHGAAHPVELASFFTWVLPVKREIEEGDIFVPDSGWEKVVDATCANELREEFGGKLDEDTLDANVADIVKSPKSWVLSAKGLGISFAARTVGQKIVVVAVVVVPWADLKKYLVAGFVKPA